MTPTRFRSIRRQRGWSVYDLANALNLDGSLEKAGTRVREMERDARPITGPIARLMEAFADGWTPADFAPLRSNRPHYPASGSKVGP